MALNEIFEKNFPPYCVPGRWYDIYLTSDGSNISLAYSDLSGVEATNYSECIILTFPSNFIVGDHKEFFKISDTTGSRIEEFVSQIERTKTGKQFCLEIYFSSEVDMTDMIDDVHIYVYGYFAE